MFAYMFTWRHTHANPATNTHPFRFLITYKLRCFVPETPLSLSDWDWAGYLPLLFLFVKEKIFFFSFFFFFEMSVPKHAWPSSVSSVYHDVMTDTQTHLKGGCVSFPKPPSYMCLLPSWCFCVCKCACRQLCSWNGQREREIRDVMHTNWGVCLSEWVKIRLVLPYRLPNLLSHFPISTPSVLSLSPQTIHTNLIPFCVSHLHLSHLSKFWEARDWVWACV